MNFINSFLASKYVSAIEILVEIQMLHLPNVTKYYGNSYCCCGEGVRVSLGRFPSENCQANPLPLRKFLVKPPHLPEPEKIAIYLVISAQKGKKG